MSLLEVAPGQPRSRSSEPAALAARLAAAGLVLLVAGCAGSTEAAPRATSPKAPAEARSEAPLPPRPPLSADETAMIPRLEGHTTQLVGIGERNPDRPWELASAADYVVERLESFGFPVERVGYEVAGVAAQNLVVTVQGREQPEEVWLVGAHYDTARGDRGEERNATGVAALLELARMMREARCSRTLRLVAFTLSAPPFAGTDDMGSVRYLKYLADKPAPDPETREKIVGMINLDGVGALGAGRGPLGAVHVRLGAPRGGEALAGRLASELAGDPFEVATLPLDATPSSDHWAFARQGIPAVWVGAAGPSHLVDYDAMTRLVMKMRFFLGEVVGEQLTNDGMLTPGLGPVH